MLWEWARLLLAILAAGAIPVPSLSAADKNGVSPNTISLPKGPGSIEGLGESFQPTLNTGTAKYAVAIKLPPGTAGHQPAVSLTYEAGGGNGPLGFGWQLPVSFVQRQTDEGIPTYGENVGVVRADRFIADSKEVLIPQANGDFFSENEGSFVRYRQVGDAWVGNDPDGSRLDFGISESGRIQEGTNRVFSWLLEREVDTRGNTIVYTYTNFPGPENLNQKYLSTIRYGPGAPPWQHYKSVSFVYEDRPDWFEDCRAGFPVRTGKRLKSIIIAAHTTSAPGHLSGDWDGDGAPDFLVRRYDCEYLKYAGTNSHWSLLAKVTPVGADGTSTLPASEFSYSVCNPPETLSAAGHVLGGQNEPELVMDNALVDFIDLNGDGLPDVLETGGLTHRAYLNRGAVTNQAGRAIQWGPASDVASPDQDAWNFNLSESSTHLADMDGDALADLVHKSVDGSVFFFRNRGHQQWDIRQAMASGTVLPPAPFGANDVRTADLDFDKRIDLVRGDGLEYQVWFNLGSNTYSEAITVPQSNPFDFAIESTQVADMNGDRVPDVAQVWPSGVDVTAGLGYGRFGALRTMSLPDYTLEPADLAHAKLTDITEDGLADLVVERSSTGDLWYWVNLGNYRFSTRKVITGMPSGLGNNPAVRWVDIDGNGSTDLVYADSTWTPRMTTVDVGEVLNAGLPPNSLLTISNGLGRVTLIGYAPSTRYAMEDAAAGQPWTNTLPNAVTVVSEVTNLDSLGHQYVTRFQYHEGYYDPLKKQFRGFARVEQVDVGDSSAPTLVSRSHFDVGRAFESLKGKLLGFTVEQEDGLVFTTETNFWTVPPVTLYTNAGGQNVTYAHPVSSAKAIIELGRGTARRLETEVDFDRFGNQVFSANYGIVEGTNRSAFNDERIISSEFAINTNAWILRTPKRMETRDENGVVISRSEMFYDDETFSGNNAGLVAVGNLTLKRDWIDPSQPAAFVESARTKYDAFGNARFIVDPLAVAAGGTLDLTKGHVREVAYDPRFHTYALSETIHLGNGSAALVFQAEYDEVFGVVTAGVNFNTNRNSYTYDTFARLTGVVKPGDAAGYPSVEYDYALAVPAPYWINGGGAQQTGLVNYVETRQLDRDPGAAGSKRDHYLISRTFSDGLGRTLMNRSEAEPAPGQQSPRVVVTGAVLFNARMKPAAVLNPFFTLQAGSLDQELGFENVEAPGWTGQFHENGALIAMNLASAHRGRTEYDATLRMVRITNADGTYGRTEFEPLSILSFDENDVTTNSPYFDTPMVRISDGLGRLTRVDERVRLKDDGTPAAAVQTWTTRYEYDLNDRLTRITDSQDNVKLLRYDGLQRKMWMNDPDAGISTNVYDSASNLIETTDAKGQRVTYTYDGANRILTEDYHDESSLEFSYQRSPDVRYHYDAPPGPVDQGNGSSATAANARGMLAWVEDTSGQEHTSFDARGRIEWTVKRVPDPVLTTNLNDPAPILVSYKTAFTYDGMDRIQRMVYPDNDEITYEYNARGLVEGITGGPSGHILAGVGYLPSAQQERIEYGNGVRTTYEYDSRMRLTHLLTVSKPASLNQQLINLGYELDGVSNIRSIEDLRPESVVSATDPRRNTQRFQYDDLYRLTQVRYNSGAAEPPTATNAVHYRYDRIGNMLAQVSDIVHAEKGLPVADLGNMAYGGPAGRFGRTGRQASDPPGPHALSQIASVQAGVTNRVYPYDANGNMKVIDGLRCTWDFRDRLVGVEDDTMRAEYRYDFTGRRIIKRVFPKESAPPQPAAATNSAPGKVSVLYPNRDFEVREHEEPTKYVFSGNTRIARATGSLDTDLRVQRLRVHGGWNLCSLAVTVTNVAEQLFRDGTVQGAAFRWDASAGSWSKLAPAAVGEAGMVLWIQATTNAALTVVGVYSAPTNRWVGPAGFVASAGLQAWDLRRAFVQRPAGSVGRYDAKVWTCWLPPPLDSIAAFPDYLSPGAALFVSTGSPQELQVPEAALLIRYYHEDHLGSSGVIADADGSVLEETAFYPFGDPRKEHRWYDLDEAYKFSQKERDRESGLQYFEARYLAGALARFSIPDPKYTRIEGLEADELEDFLDRPQNGNRYAYAANNPLRYTDPSGLDNLDPYGKVNDTLGTVSGGMEEANHIVTYSRGTELLGKGVSTVASVVGKATAVISMGIQTYRFVKDPSAATGGQLLNETAKTLTSIALPPVGLIWAIADLTGYGPSAILEATEKSIQANRAATKAYQQATAAAKQTVALVAEAEPRIRRRLAEVNAKVDKLNAETQRWRARSLASLKGETRSLAQLNAAIAKQEKVNRQTAARLKYWEARARKAQKE